MLLLVMVDKIFIKEYCDIRFLKLFFWSVNIEVGLFLVKGDEEELYLLYLLYV